MRTIRIKLYKFDELSEQAKQRAIEEHQSVNVDFNWWEMTYEDAKTTAALTISGFEIDRQGSIEGEIDSAMESAIKITENHGPDADTFKLATQLIKDWGELVTKYSDGVIKDRVSEGNEDAFDQEADEMEKKYEKALLQSYLRVLREEYEYLLGDEAIQETIISNEWEFTEDGKWFNS